MANILADLLSGANSKSLGGSVAQGFGQAMPAAAQDPVDPRAAYASKTPNHMMVNGVDMPMGAPQAGQLGSPSNPITAEQMKALYARTSPGQPGGIGTQMLSGTGFEGIGQGFGSIPGQSSSMFAPTVAPGPTYYQAAQSAFNPEPPAANELLQQMLSGGR